MCAIVAELRYIKFKNVKSGFTPKPSENPVLMTGHAVGLEAVKVSFEEVALVGKVDFITILMLKRLNAQDR